MEIPSKETIKNKFSHPITHHIIRGYVRPVSNHKGKSLIKHIPLQVFIHRNKKVGEVSHISIIKPSISVGLKKNHRGPL
jgi:hypothetical protein